MINIPDDADPDEVTEEQVSFVQTIVDSLGPALDRAKRLQAGGVDMSKTIRELEDTRSDLKDLRRKLGLNIEFKE